MDDINPFQSPREVGRPADLFVATVESSGCWRDGKFLVVTVHGAQSPTHCIRCNAPGVRKTTQKLNWYPPALALTLLLGVVPGALLITLMQKKATIDLYLCQRHNRSWIRNRFMAAVIWLLAAGSTTTSVVLAMLVGRMPRARDIAPGFLLAGIVFFMLGLIAWPLVAPIIDVKRINKQFAWLRGASLELLDGLPEFPSELR